MSYYRELNELEVGQLQVGDKVMVNNVKTEIVRVDIGISGVIGFITKAPLIEHESGEDSYFWGKHTSTNYKVYKLTEGTTMKTKQFTKADLKTGHRVHFRDGSVGVCFERSPSHSGLHVVNFDDTWCGLSTHEDDLTYEGDHDLDIVKVTSVRVYRTLNQIAPETTIWEREAPKSKEQIAYDEAVEATEAARQAYELAQKKLEALNPSGFSPAKKV